MASSRLDDSDRAAIGTVVFALAQGVSTGIPTEYWTTETAGLPECAFLNATDGRLFHLISQSIHENIVQAAFRICIPSPDQIAQLHIRIYLLPISPSKLTKSHTTALQTILGRTSRDRDAWECRAFDQAAFQQQMFNNQYTDHRSLSGIFQDLPSPLIDFSPSSLPEGEARRILDESSRWEAPVGMRSVLHPYQRRTVWRMLKQELDPGRAIDARFIPLQSLDDGRLFYFNPGNALLRAERDVQYDQPRGGILCEEMGCGKTCMCIAVILATKGRTVTPPATHQDPVALTQIALDHFPFPPFNSQLAGSASSCPSLVHLALHMVRTSPDVNSERTLAKLGAASDIEHARRFETFLSTFNEREQALFGTDALPFYYEYSDEWHEERTRHRRLVRPPPRKVYLSAISLVLVPKIIFRQWTLELVKHCNDGALRVLWAEETSVQLPPVETLIREYDVILMTHDRFARETTAFPDTPSPLLNMRFQRIIIDEGHVTNVPKNELKELAMRLSVESRWVVTGTPTTNIKALNLGASPESPVENDGLGFGSVDGEGNRSPTDMSCNAGSWDVRDRPDVIKLGNMFRFLQVPPFLSGDADWTSTVVQPLFRPGRPEFGAVYRLVNCMSRVMIRHRAEDIENDVVLPRLSQEIVMLDLDEYAAMTHNSILAQIAINAIDSERTDQDYLFNSRNRGFLGQVIQNLSQSLFWHTDNETDFDERVRTAEKSLETAKKRNTSIEDMLLITKAIHHLSKAASHRTWRLIMKRESLPFRISNLPYQLQNSWLRLPLPDMDEVGCKSGCLLEPDRITWLRRICGMHREDVISDAFETLASIGLNYTGFEEMNNQWILSQKQFKLKESKPRPKQRSDDDNGIVEEDRIMHVQVGSSFSPRSPSKKHRKKSKAIGDEVVVTPPGYQMFYHPDQPPPSKKAFPPHPLLCRTTVGLSLSNKVNFILSEVIKYSGEEKIVIFSSSALSLAHLTEAFDLWRIKYLHFSNLKSTNTREHVVQSFETSEVYRVLLMELKHGARGLNLVSASRVIFCEPVWRADVESQAIKRCHRIGQTRNVTVKTLVIRGTAESEVVRVRKLHSRDDPHTKGMEDDASIKHFIEHPTFLTSASMEWPLLTMPLLKSQPSVRPEGSPAQGITSRAVRFAEEVSVEEEKVVDLDGEPPRKKKRAVRFAD